MTWQESIQTCRHFLLSFCLCFERLHVFLLLNQQGQKLTASAGRLTTKTNNANERN